MSVLAPFRNLGGSVVLAVCINVFKSKIQTVSCPSLQQLDGILVSAYFSHQNVAKVLGSSKTNICRRRLSMNAGA